MTTEHCPNEECGCLQIVYLGTEENTGYDTVEHYKCEKCGTEFDRIYETTTKIEITRKPTSASGIETTLSDYVKRNYHQVVEEPVNLWIKRYLPPYFLEQKIDGTMVFGFKAGEKLFLATKHNGTYGPADYPETFRDLKEAFSTVNDCIFYAELDWHQKPEVLHVHDIMSMNGTDLRGMKLSQRKQILETVILEQRTIKIVPYKLVSTHLEILDEKNLRVARGEEGIMVKADVPYTTTGNSWLKVKGTVELDIVVTRVKESDGFLEDGTPWTVDCHVYDEGGQQVSVGSVSSCVKGVDRKQLISGAVLRIKCYKVWPSYKLRHPTILEIRKDKLPQECLLMQLQQHIKIAQVAGL